MDTLLPPGTKSAVVIDIDGTLADNSHRRHFVEKKCGSCGHDKSKIGEGKNASRTCGRCGARWPAKDWGNFFEAMDDDVLNNQVAVIANLFRCAGVSVVLCSGRHEKWRERTEAWLRKWLFEVDAIYMRSNDDSRDDSIVKRELLARIREDGYEPFVVLDDRDRVVNMWREEGLTCFQVAPGDF